jgi:hypothetical protein
MTAQEICTRKAARHGVHRTAIAAGKIHLSRGIGKKGTFSIAKSVKFKDQYGPERIARLL